LIRLIKVVFSKGAMLSVSDKSESVNERTLVDQQKINKIPYSRGSPAMPMNWLGNWLIAQTKKTRSSL